MAYTAEISRSNPSCFLFLIDQSRSMSDPFSNLTKSHAVADAVNRLLHDLCLKCAKSEGVRDYFHVGVIGYGASVGPAFGGALSGREFVPVSDVERNPLRIEDRTKKVADGAGGLIEQTVKFPVWFDPVADDGTPMAEALAQGKGVLRTWLAAHPGCYPPIVVNITDGEPNPGSDPAGEARQIMGLSSADGNVLLYNIHISSLNANPVMFPDSSSGLPDQYARFLFDISSVLPGQTQAIARQQGFHVTENSRGFAFNADMVQLISFLDIGTRPVNMR